jgi:uncharacterized protein YkwD
MFIRSIVAVVLVFIAAGSGMLFARILSSIQSSTGNAHPPATQKASSGPVISGVPDERDPVIKNEVKQKEEIVLGQTQREPEAPAPAPLRKVVAPKESLPGALKVVAPRSPAAQPATLSGDVSPGDIVILTNAERDKAGLARLSANGTLNAIASAKAKDMATRNYFAHDSPEGKGAGDLAEEYGYGYLNIGENLALGNFSDSGDVVTGWMNSPGHRANILYDRFTEIGVGIAAGIYEGSRVYYIAQEFGRPSSVCPAPSESLRMKIDLYRGQVETLSGTLDRLRAEIEDPNTPVDVYQTDVRDYNTIVDLYNKLIRETREDISAYNAAVDTYNACLGEQPGDMHAGG